MKELLKNNFTNRNFFIMTNSDKCMEPRVIQKKFKTLLKKENLPDYNLHDP